MSITLDEARAELTRIMQIGEIGVCRRHVGQDELLARAGYPEYFKCEPRHQRNYAEIRGYFRSLKAERQRPVVERQARKRQRAAAMLVARMRKVRANDPEWLEIQCRAEAISSLTPPAKPVV